MEEPTREVLDVVRARRVEIVDAAGKVRVVIGDLGAMERTEAVGIAVADASGRERAWLATHEFGAALSFDVGGNVVAEFGVEDPSLETVTPSARLVLCDGRGAPVLGWAVTSDGRVLADAPADE